ncbi:MAG: trypsin-like peptidase domain-containing protein [Chloroflexi bacterium]|nr:trypsin-like peptidase domain-containing protein [Chloroflexota bacterium]
MVPINSDDRFTENESSEEQALSPDVPPSEEREIPQTSTEPEAGSGVIGDRSVSVGDDRAVGDTIPLSVPHTRAADGYASVVAPSASEVKQARNAFVRTIATSVVSAIVGGLIVLGALSAYFALRPEGTVTVVGNAGNNRPIPVAVKDGKTLAPQTIYDQFGPAVVHVTADITQQSRDFFGNPTQSNGRSDGSGFVVDGAGYIVTNAHVVDASNNITVSLSDKKQLKAKIVGVDRSSDLALLKIDPAGESLTVIELGDSSKVRVGDTVYAIGNPFSLDGSMSNGIVSAVGRQIQAPNGFTIRNVIQTDAAVNPGNSGGPLIDAYGQVIGVNAQIESQANQFAGIAFAIPSDTVKAIVQGLKSGGKVSHAWLGIQGSDVTPDLKQNMKLSTDSGVVISNVLPGGPAEKAGLQAAKHSGSSGQGDVAVGDIIVEVDGTKIAGMEDLLSLVEKHKVNDKINVVVLRGGRRQTISITLGERPQELVQQ